MEKWEYGYVYGVTVFASGESHNIFVVLEGDGNRVLRNVPTRLALLNSLGAQGWIISETPYLSWPTEIRGWLHHIVKEEIPETGNITINAIHFMRRPRA